MSLDLAVAIIVLLDVAMLAGLAWVMSQPRKLTPHLTTPTVEELEREQSEPSALVHSRSDLVFLDVL